VLLDVHSMPPPGEVEIVFGDRFGRTAAARFVHRIEAEAEAAGFAHALNTPYSGGHILDRHGAPLRGVHAIQIEWSRALYLDAALDVPGPGLPRVAATLRAMIDALADEAIGSAQPLAAE
jgi:N-formylglutamate amidohydrolase